MLPIPERELRVAARHPKTHRTRSLTALVVLACGAAAVWVLDAFGGALISGPDIFVAVSTAALIYYVFAGCATTADSLSEEKRAGTLGLLFLTDLKGHDVVLGKLLATSLHTFYGFLTTLPLFALTFIMGGVKLGEFWRVILNLGVTLFLSLSTGLFVSSMSRQNRRALSAASSIILVFMFILPVLAELVRRNGYSPEVAFVLQFLSPLNTHFMAMEAASALRQNLFWWSLLTNFLISLGLLAVASFVLPRAWQDKPLAFSGQIGKGWRGFWQQFKLGPIAKRHAVRTRYLKLNPFYWLANRERFSTATLWLFILFVCLTVAGVHFRYGVSEPNFADMISMMGAVMLVVSILINFAAKACQRLAEDRESGTLELLLSTPLSVQSILRGQWLALGRQYGSPLAAVILIDGMILWLQRSPVGLPKQDTDFMLCMSLMAAVLIVLLIGLGWTGMWMALRVKQASHASGSAVWRIMLLPCPIIAALLQAFFWNKPSSYFDTHLPHLVPATIITVLISNSVAWSIWCRHKLYKDFRVAATDRFQPPHPHGSWWQTFFKWSVQSRLRVADRGLESTDATIG